jgi:adenosine deaminase
LKSFESKYNEIPKIELHCHLEGSVRTETMIDLAKDHPINLPTHKLTELDQIVKIREQLSDLKSVLRAFSIFQACMASEEAVERITYELCEDASNQNIKLLEIRFSPDWAFSGHNLDWDLALEGITSAQKRAFKDFGIYTGLIAISSRGMGLASCEKTINWATRHKDVIQGIDLADNEMEHPIHEFVHAVEKAKEAGLMVTVHSGEESPASFVIDTIQAVHPNRIGHGIHIIQNQKAVETVIENGITLEVNPWSNYLTNSVKKIEEHPLKQLLDLGVKVTINSDDPEVLDTNLNNEYRIACEILGMSIEEIQKCNAYALEASFLPGYLKEVLVRQFPEWSS